MTYTELKEKENKLKVELRVVREQITNLQKKCNHKGHGFVKCFGSWSGEHVANQCLGCGKEIML